MNTRMRSPNYPSTPLREAVDLIGRIFRIERTNPIDRAVAAQAMGYSGISGRSAKVLANLTQYGLLERGGKNEVRVSPRAVEILHPDTPGTRLMALREAAFEPELFQRITERFPDGRPSEAALRSYFIKEQFTDAAIPSAIRAYLETYQYLEDQNANESSGLHGVTGQESHENQGIIGEANMRYAQAEAVPGSTVTASAPVPTSKQTESGPTFSWSNNKISLGGTLANKKEAEDLVSFINAMKQFLEDAPQPAPADGESGK